MGSVFTLKEVANGHSDFLINSKKNVEFQLNSKKQAYISFGSRRHYVSIKTSDFQAEDEIHISKNVINDLYLPEYIMYEICVNKNEIVLGPYIGLLISNEDERLTETRLNKMLVYASNYSELNGALVVFALDKVDKVNQLVEGYCYNPFENRWRRGVFPYPASIYRNVGLSKEWKNHFLSTIGDKIFNNRYFNKREMYEWLSSHSVIKPYLPYTMVYQSFNDVQEMIKRFGKVYAKPVSGMKGRGIVQISQEGESVVFRFRKNGKNHQVVLDDRGAILEYIQKSFHNKNYLIQQSIDVLKYNGRVADFRCVLQKNQSGEWVQTAIFGRCGERCSIVSNVSSGGETLVAEDLLAKILSTLKEDVGIVKQKIEYLVLNVCNALSEYGLNLGILGLDICIDSNGRIWLIEINNRDPCSVYALDIGDEQLYYRLKTNLIFYAKFLAGFKG